MTIAPEHLDEKKAEEFGERILVWRVTTKPQE